MVDWQGLTLAEAEGLRESVLAALGDGEPRTRAEIGDAVGGRFGEHIAADSWGHYLSPAGGEICHGPPRGRTVTFVRCDRWVAGGTRRSRRRRCARCAADIRVYGPAQRGELEHWLSLRFPDEALDGLEEVDVEGRTAFALPGTTFRDAAPGVCACSRTTTCT